MKALTTVSMLVVSYTLTLTGYAQTGSVSYNATLEQDELDWTWTANNVTEATLTFQPDSGEYITEFTPEGDSGWLFDGLEGEDWEATVAISDQTGILTVTLTRLSGPVSGSGIAGGGVIVMDDEIWRIAQPANPPFFLAQNPSQNLTIDFSERTSQQFTLRVVNQQGQIVHKAQVEPGTERLRDFMDLPRGYYLVQIEEKPEWTPLRWIKQ